MHCEWCGKYRITLVNVGHHIIHRGSWDLKNVMIHGGLGVLLKPRSHTFAVSLAGRCLDTLQHVEGETPRRLASWYHRPQKDA